MLLFPGVASATENASLRHMVGRLGASASVGAPDGRSCTLQLRTRLCKCPAASPAPQQTATATSDTAPVQPLPAAEARYQLITELADLQAFLDIASKQGFLAVDTETTSLNAAAADLVGVAMAVAPGHACYVPLRHGGATVITTNGQSGLDFEGAEDAAPVGEPRVPLVGRDGIP